MTSRQPHSVLQMALLVTGILVGAGILGLPIKTGLVGFGWSVAAMLAIWATQIVTGFIMADHFTRPETDRNEDMPAFFSHSLGSAAGWLATALILLIIYGLLIGYTCGAAAIISSLIPGGGYQALSTLIFFIPATALALFGMKIVTRGNIVLMVLMWLTFAAIVITTAGHVEARNLAFTDLAELPSALPIMITALSFQTIIPSICRGLNGDRALTRKALLLGSLIGLGMMVIWIFVVLGALPISGQEGSILSALQHDQPATVPLAKVITSPLFIMVAVTFSLIAILTSYLASSVALMGMVRYLTIKHLPRSDNWLIAALVFIPPITISLVYPDLFLMALDLIGGVGIVLLFGLLPCLVLIRQGRSRPGRLLGWLLALVFLFILGCEIAQEAGLLTIDPGAEIWKTQKLR